MSLLIYFNTAVISEPEDRLGSQASSLVVQPNSMMCLHYGGDGHGAALLCSSQASLQQGQALSNIPLRKLHDRLAGQGRTLRPLLPLGMKDRLGQSFDFRNQRQSIKNI